MANMVEMSIEKIDELKSRLGRSLGASMRLRDLIRQVRAARTAAEERAVVERESANIRDSFRDEDNKYRCRNMAKLFYIHMLGYPAHFGQMECMKLVGTKDKRFTDIRIGYLGAMLLLDERSEVHLLVTNCLKSHLSESDQFVTGLALCTLGSICSEGMCRDLSNEVEKLLVRCTNTYIKKKAALCAFRIVRKVPDLIQCFMTGSRQLLNEKHHGVLMGGLTLATEMCEKSIDVRNHFRQMVPVLVRKFKELLTTGYSTEHDITGVSDPFLQIKILKLLRILGKDDAAASEHMNDLLAQISTNTDTSKNVGNAILYETVLTIMEIKSESGLKILGTNILGRYLVNPDKNIRYVALNTLLKTASVDLNTVQRYRGTVVDNLKDPDVSIRRRALELCFVLISKSNIADMSKEILLFLENADPEFKAECASKMYIATERFSPSSEWHLNTMISVLKLAGNHVPEEVVSAMIQLISSNSSLQGYGTKQLFRCAQIDSGNAQPLLQIAFWCIGEFGDLLVSSSDNEEAIDENSVVELFEKLMISPVMLITTREYGLVALAKLSTRFGSSMENIHVLIRRYMAHMNLELQQRSVEFSKLLQTDDLKFGLLERMPVIEQNKLNAAAVPIEGDEDQRSGEQLLFDADQPAQQKTGQSNYKNDLLDLMGIGGDAETQPVSNGSLSSTQTSSKVFGLEDLLGGLPSSETKAPSAPVSQIQASDPFADLFNTNGSTTQKSEPVGTIVVNKQGVEVQLFVDSTFEGGNQAVLRLVAVNNNPAPIEKFNFQAAVTKTYQIELLPANSARLEANGMSTITQTAKVNKLSDGAGLRVRLRLNYNISGESRSLQEDISSIPGI